MRQLTKEVYETPLTTKRVVTMESSCMAASGEEMKNSTVSITAEEQNEGKSFDFTGNNWE